MTPLRRYLLVSFLTWLPIGLMMGPMVLLMTERGLSLAQIGLVTTVFNVVTVTLELPTGGLADVIGRRTVLAISAAFLVLAMAGMAVATTFWMFLVVSVLKAIARALSSGPAEAWYVDTVGRDSDLKPGLAKGGATGSVALCAGVLAGGFVPLAVPEGVIMPLAVPPLLGAVAAAVLLVVVLVAMPEPARARGASVGLSATMLAGARMAFGRGVLRRLMLLAAANGVALCSVELLTPGRLAALAGTAELGTSAYAVVAALGFASSALGSLLAPRLVRLLGTPARGSMAGVALTAVALGTLAATSGLAGSAGLVSAGVAYVVMFSGLAAAQVPALEMTHKAVPDDQRATLTSVASLSLQGGGAAANLTLGALASQSGTAAAWSVAAVVALASAALFVRMPATSPAPGRAARSATGSRSSG
ncbi:MFS transporter [Nonomuraea sp. NPDC050536]|uniref:MFS transporter n=1 Tax=Nonomuraea sp. NPDC050536 TaxID=3364366 RepID=UPI0037CB6973